MMKFAPRLEQYAPQTEVCGAFHALAFHSRSEFHLPKANFIANNRRLFARLLDSYCYCDSHSDHGVVTCADQTHHLYVKFA